MKDDRKLRNVPVLQAASLRGGLSHRFPRLEKEEQNKSADVEGYALLEVTSHEAQHQSEQGERVAQRIAREIARSPVVQADEVVGMKRQTRRRAQYQCASHHENHSHDRHTQR